ncbi:MAG TPA: glycosyltransferase family 4 protein [Terriglobia bacterium]|nr:glycosyltransferase family 4 protein [Terriglobia bacterium]
MNVLVLTAYPPVLAMHGGGVRMFHNIRILSTRHHVHVISFVGDDEERERLRSLSAIAASVTAVRRVPDFRPHWLSLKPFLAREFSTPEMSRVVMETIRSQRIDVVQCEYLQMAQFRSRRLPSVLTAHETLARNAYDAFRTSSEPAERLHRFYLWMQLLRYETQQTRKFDRVITMTEEDARYLRSYAPGAQIRAIPIGVDTDEFSPLEEDPGQRLSALFVGNFRHFPNVAAVRFLVDRIAPIFPEIQFVIPGDHLPGDVKAPGNVVFPGYVQDTRVLYRRPNTIVVTPLFSGSGQRVKLLEAFSMGCPVITTRLGAAGYPVVNGEQALFAETPEEFASAISKLASDTNLRRSMGSRGRRMALGRFAWNGLATQYLDVVEEAVAARRVSMKSRNGVSRHC